MAYDLGDEPASDLVNRPSVFIGLEIYLIAFSELDLERSNGLGAGRIPQSAIVEWCRHYHFDDDEIEDFKFIITQMDSALLEKIKESEKAKQNHGKRLTKPSRGNI